MIPEYSPGPVLIGLEKTELTDFEKDVLKHPGVGGVVLFTRNYRDREQLKELNSAIREHANADMVICVDHEGGRVQRFREGFTRLPPLALLGRMYLDSADTARDFAYRHGRVMATELLVCGVDHSFAPVLDLDVESCVIGDRSFAADPEVVTDLGRFLIAGIHDAGMKVCGKHFPGHGSVLADSHVDDVVDDRSLEQIESMDLVPFTNLLADLDSLMMAHVVYPRICPQPAGYSAHWIKQVLREQMSYHGVILSDDLGMHAAHAAGSLRDRFQISIEAGCDAVLVCQPEDVSTLFSELGGQGLEACPQLLDLKGRSGETEEQLTTVSEWRHWQQSLLELEQSKWA